MQIPEERNIRINKVLRELNISLERAINYLTFVGVKIESNPNSKISLFEYKLLFDEFSKSKVILKDRYYSEEANIRIYKVLAELNISLTEAINFWKVSGYEILSNPNTLITEREYSIIKNNFVPIPIEIFEIENFYNIKLKIQDEPNGYENQNNFQLNENNKLVALNLSNNAITDLGILKILPDMKILLLNDNLIQDLYHLSFLNNLTQLDLSNNIIDDLSGLSDLKNLKLLNLFNNNIFNLFPLKHIVSLTTLDLHKNKIVDLKGLENLKNLMYLNLSGNFIFGDYSQLSNLNELKTLRITDNKILNFDFLPISLSDLSLKDCQIKDISFLSKNTDLESLDLSYNLISDISVLKKLKNLRRLNLTWNAIQDLSQFESIKFLYDIDLRVAENPFVMNKNLVLDKNGNHFFTVINAMLKENELKSLYEIVDNFTLPAKVLLLGNTQSGKSTMMNYLLQEGNTRKINECKDSTHILSIVTKPKNVKINDLPQAIFFDFGGQDYYHGLYRAFLNNGALSILFWNVENDKNQIREDGRNRIFTRDFDRNYWLHQLKYIENKNDWHPFGKDPSEKSNTVLMVQTYADKEGIKRNTYNGDCDNMNIENEFFVALNQDSIDKNPKYKISLDYFEAVLNEQILLKQETKTETKWYSDFLNYIQQQKGATATNLTEIGKHYKRDSDKMKKYLPEVLKDLARTGLILYYNDDTDLKDIAWLDPTATIAYIHKNILKNEELIKNKGKIDRLKFEENDLRIIKLLKNQKVVFLDQNPLEDKYIVPGYLTLTTDDNLIYDLMTFDFIEPNFVLKFKNFIPFGLINQLICYYGNNSEKKHFWRDQLLFTKDDFKVLIKLDFNNLEILVSIKSKNNKQFLNDIERELFVNILDMYNFEDIFDSEKNKDTFLQFSEIFGSNPDSEIENPFGILEKMHYNSPDDMFLSIDNKTFVHHKSLEDKNKTQSKITSFGLDEFSDKQNGKEIIIRKISEAKTREQSSGLYKNFTTNDNIKNMKKIFISYAKENLNSVHDFEKQIAPFKLSGEVQTWYCSNLELGEDWENKISTKFYEADIILYFISTNFFSTPFILDFEIVNGIKRYDDPNDKVIIIPIILEKIHWSGLLGKYNSNFKGYPLSLIENPNNFWFEVVDDLTKHFQPQNENSTKSKLGLSKEKMKTHENIIKGEL